MFKKKFNKIFSIVFVILVTLSACYFLFLFPYTIDNHQKAVEKGLTKRTNNTEQVKKYLSVKEFKRIGKTNTYVAVFVVSNDQYFRNETYTGLSILKKGITGKLTISAASYGIKELHYELVKTNKGKYVVFGGVNPEQKGKTVEATFKSLKKPIVFSIPNTEYFIAYQKTGDTFEEKRFPELSIKEK